MNFSISKEKLSQILYLTSTIAERRTTMPILANVNLTLDGNKLSVIATDLEISLVGEAEAAVKAPGSITVGAKVLYDIVRDLPSDTVTLHVSKGQRLEIEAGQSRFRINGISSDEFPSVVGTTLLNPIAVDALKLYEMLDRTVFCVSLDETRYNINGVCVEMLASPSRNDSATIRFVATDGHRLAMIDRPAEGLAFNESLILPRKGIQELKKVLENKEGVVYVGVNEGFFTTQCENVTIGIRLIDGQFPDYKQVIPVETTTKIELPRNDFYAAVKRVSLVTTDKSKTIKFRIVNGNMVVSSSSPEYGEASESLNVSQEGGDVTIGFSAKYVSDLLAAMSNAQTVTLKLNGEVGPGVFTGNDDELYTCIVMPMRFE